MCKRAKCDSVCNQFSNELFFSSSFACHSSLSIICCFPINFCLNPCLFCLSFHIFHFFFFVQCPFCPLSSSSTSSTKVQWDDVVISVSKDRNRLEYGHKSETGFCRTFESRSKCLFSHLCCSLSHLTLISFPYSLWLYLFFPLLPF